MRNPHNSPEAIDQGGAELVGEQRITVLRLMVGEVDHAVTAIVYNQQLLDQLSGSGQPAIAPVIDLAERRSALRATINDATAHQAYHLGPDSVEDVNRRLRGAGDVQAAA